MLNTITIMGRMGKDPELRQTQSGKSVANFSLAVTREFKNPDGSYETDWIDCVAWGTTADFLTKYGGKGRMAVVSGRLQSRKWKDRDGNNRIAWEVQVSNAYFADRRDADGSSTADGNGYGGGSSGNGGASQGYGTTPQGYYGATGYGAQGAQSGVSVDAQDWTEDTRQTYDDGDLPF